MIARTMMCSRPFRTSAVLFDFDDTLTQPGALDFARIRQAIGCPMDTPILEYIASIADNAEREQALGTLTRMELEAAGQAQPDPAAAEVMQWLRDHGLKIGILTRNGRQAVDRAFQNFPQLEPSDFDVIVSRNDSAEPKPGPGGVLLAAEQMGVDPAELMVVGDFIFDIEAGHAAGAVTVLLQHGHHLDAGYANGVLEPAPDFTITALADVPAVVRLGLPLPAGKFPGDLLEQFLDSLPTDDPSLVVGPHVGRDVAVIDVDGHRLLTVGSDPVTFTTTDLSAWGVLINANDIATCGAMPRWFSATLLFPVGVSSAEVLAELNALREACHRQGVSLCGGHTEVTDAVTRPVISGTLIGTATDRGLVDKRTVSEGDAIILTKRVAVEGTALLAGELRAELTAAGLASDELEACLQLRAQLSVVEEARVALCFDGVSAMHDVTEGGLSTAVAELAAAGQHAVRIDADAVPYYPQTVRVCELLKLNPLGLIGSGSLLICCRKSQADALLTALIKSDIEAAQIGEVLEPLPVRSKSAARQITVDPVQAWSADRRVPWPTFAVDEAARVLPTLLRTPPSPKV